MLESILHFGSVIVLGVLTAIAIAHLLKYKPWSGWEYLIIVGLCAAVILVLV